MANWKKLIKIDAHIHLLPNDVIEANKEYNDKFVQYGNINDYLSLMNKYNISKAFIMPFNDPYMMSMDFTVESSNHNLIDLASTNPGSFYFYADIDISKSVDETLNNLSLTITNENCIGIKIHPNNAGYPIDGLYYDDIFNYAIKNNLIVEINSYPKDNLIDDLCSPLRIKKVLDKYPNLIVSIAHLGGFQYEDFYDVDCYYNISAILSDLVNKLGIFETNIILRKIGVQKLIFATDFPDNRTLEPNQIYDYYIKTLEKMDFTQKEAEDICFNNVVKMLEKSRKK